MGGNGHALARRLHAVLGPGRQADMAGQMFAVPDADGWYPAVVPGQGVARGMVHDGDGLDGDLWRALDEFEQVVAEGPGYRRADVILSGAVRAQAWVWQGALPEGALALEDGDFAAFLAKTGQRAFGA